MTPEDEFRAAVRRLHQVKDASYRDAWKRRGEVISVMANVARKVDRLEYGLDGAPSPPGESQLDTAVDLLVYCVKYQAYLADQDHGTAARLFAGSTVRPPYSDGPAGFEELLARADFTAVTGPGLPAAGTARLVAARFAELEAWFGQAGAPQPTSVRLIRLLALTDAAAGLAGALWQEHAQTYAGFSSASRHPERREGAADAR